MVRIMNYDEWQAEVPEDLRRDPLWSVELYRFALYATEIAWEDALLLSKTSLTRDLANQLYRAICSISANIAEGYSRSTAKDRAHFLEYSLGSAREARDWYYKAHHVLSPDLVTDRIGRLTQIIKILTVLVQQQRQKGIRERSAAYDAAASAADSVAEPF